jgi:hypothetical protein
MISVIRVGILVLADLVSLGGNAGSGLNRMCSGVAEKPQVLAQVCSGRCLLLDRH